ncbi:MAG: hypothetical protein IPH57_11445 [Saprospiraceae bacterium]|nr:hypothetical protein [Saprospiraceae bacterium]
MNDVSPQKETSYESPNPYVLIGFIQTDNHIQCIENSEKPFYFSGNKKPSKFGFKNLKYFAPYIKGMGVKSYYEIISYEIIKRNQIQNAPLTFTNDNMERLVIWLGKEYLIDRKLFKNI